MNIDFIQTGLGHTWNGQDACATGYPFIWNPDSDGES